MDQKFERIVKNICSSSDCCQNFRGYHARQEQKAIAWPQVRKGPRLTNMRMNPISGIGQREC